MTPSWNISKCSVRKKSQIGEPGSKCIFVWPIYLKIYEFFLSKKFRDEFRCFSIVSPNSEIFKIVIFKSKLCFWGKMSKIITRMNSWIFTNSHYLWFLKFSWKSRKSYTGWIRKNPRINPILSFSLQIDILGLKIKVWYFLGIQPKHCFYFKKFFDPFKIFQDHLNSFLDDLRFWTRRQMRRNDLDKWVFDNFLKGNYLRMILWTIS